MASTFIRTLYGFRGGFVGRWKIAVDLGEDSFMACYDIFAAEWSITRISVLGECIIVLMLLMR